MHGRHAHAPAHAHGPSVGPSGSVDRRLVAGIALNLAFVAVEVFFGWQVDALALLADAAHNLGDVAGLALAWAGVAAARVRPDAQHTYGRQRAGLLAALANAALLLVAMGWLGWESLLRLRSPEPVPGATVMAVAAVGIVVNGATALLFLRGREHDLNLRAAFWHMAGDALVSAGVVLAGALGLWLGWQRADPLVGLIVAAVVVAGAWRLFRDALHLLVDGVPPGVDLGAVHTMLAGLPGVGHVHDLHVWAMGSTRTALSAHLVMPTGGGDDAFLEHATRELHDRFAIHHATLQVMRTPFAPGCAGAIGDNCDAGRNRT